jgi:hypothetical protein
VTVVAIALLCMTSRYGLAAGKQSDELAIAIRQQIEALHKVRARRLTAHQSHRDDLARVDRQIERLGEDKESVREVVAAHQKSVLSLQQSAKNRDRERMAAEQLIADMADKALPIVQQTLKRVDVGIPFQRGDRLIRIKDIIKGLKESSGISKGEALVDFFKLAGEELRHARAIEFWNAPLQIGQQKLHAYVVRLGLVNQIFVSEDGQQVGIFGAEERGSWRRDLTEGERAQLLSALKILQGRRPPELLALPFEPRGNQ